MIRVLLVDDHAVVRAGFRWLLESEADIEIVAEAASGEAACQAYAERRPDVVVMDLSLPGIGGLDAMRRILARDPKALILVFSVHEEAIYLRYALEAGARGYISKRSAPEILVEALRRILAGETYVEPQLDRAVDPANSPLERLTPREFEIFRRLAQGCTTREVAEALHLSDKTVANYLTAIKAKLGARTAAELTRLAYRHGLLAD